MGLRGQHIAITVPAANTQSAYRHRVSPEQGRWAVLVTNKLYNTLDCQPLTDVHDSFRGLAFA